MARPWYYTVHGETEDDKAKGSASFEGIAEPASQVIKDLQSVIAEKEREIENLKARGWSQPLTAL